MIHWFIGTIVHTHVNQYVKIFEEGDYTNACIKPFDEEWLKSCETLLVMGNKTQWIITSFKLFIVLRKKFISGLGRHITKSKKIDLNKFDSIDLFVQHFNQSHEKIATNVIHESIQTNKYMLFTYEIHMKYIWNGNQLNGVIHIIEVVLHIKHTKYVFKWELKWVPSCSLSMDKHVDSSKQFERLGIVATTESIGTICIHV
jgi:hypothetical protein